MPAYAIFIRESAVRDQEAMDTYQSMNREGQLDPNLTPLAVYGALEVLEGAAPDGVVVLKFPTVEDAKAWYNSPDYQQRVPFRHKAAEYRGFIVEGIQ